MKLNEFIKKRPYLVWHVKDYNSLSKEAIVEAVLNYGDWNDVKTIIKILGAKEAARIFNSQIKKPRTNYRPKIKNFFKLYFKEHAK